MSDDAKVVSVLIVDDDLVIRMMLKTLLEHMGVRIAGEAGNGKDAVSAYRTLKPDLTLLDIEMPLKNGFDTLKEIRKINAGAEVIMLTGNDNTAVAESCIHAGARTYINKGASLDVLKAALKPHLEAPS